MIGALTVRVLMFYGVGQLDDAIHTLYSLPDTTKAFPVYVEKKRKEISAL